MLAPRLADIDSSLLERAVEERWPEASTLEFKLAPPTDKYELAKDVAAFANGEGGDLVFGIATADDTASKIVPIAGSADAEMRRMGQCIDGAIEPRIVGMQWRAVPVAGGTVVILRIPASFTGPHSVVTGVLRRFVFRNNTNASDMSYDQVRTAFDRTSSLGEQARAFRERRLELIRSRRIWRPMMLGPICAIHFIPLSAVARRQQVDIRQLHDNAELCHSFAFHDWGGSSRSFNFDGLVIHPGASVVDDPAGAPAYVQVFRTGAIEFLRHAGSFVAAENDRKFIPSTVIAGYVRDVVAKIARAAVAMDIAGPGILGVSLAGVTGYQYAIATRYYDFSKLVADRDELDCPEMWLEEVSAIEDIDEVARPVLDMIAQAFGAPRALDYDKDGNWQPR